MNSAPAPVSNRFAANPARLRDAAGFALVTVLLFLIILSVLAVSMFGSSSIQGKISGKTLDHHRAMQTAEYALKFGEWLLQNGNLTEASCTQMLDLAVPANKAVICTNPLVNPATLPWSTGLSLTPSGMAVMAGGGRTPAQGASGTTDINYARQPSLYIYKLGNDASGNPLFQLTAAGFGGSSNSVSVLQAVVSLN